MTSIKSLELPMYFLIPASVNSQIKLEKPHFLSYHAQVNLTNDHSLVLVLSG